MTIQGSKIGSTDAAASAVAVSERAETSAPRRRAEPVEVVKAESQQAVKSQEDLRRLRDAVAARLDQFLKESGREVEFRVDDDAHATVITVRRADTGEVVRQYPTEDALALLRRLNANSGTLLDQTA
jgi:flagellar protein FlaG